MDLGTVASTNEAQHSHCGGVRKEAVEKCVFSSTGPGEQDKKLINISYHRLGMGGE